MCQLYQIVYGMYAYARVRTVSHYSYLGELRRAGADQDQVDDDWWTYIVSE